MTDHDDVPIAVDEAEGVHPRPVPRSGALAEVEAMQRDAERDVGCAWVTLDAW